MDISKNILSFLREREREREVFLKNLQRDVSLSLIRVIGQSVDDAYGGFLSSLQKADFFIHPHIEEFIAVFVGKCCCSALTKSLLSKAWISPLINEVLSEIMSSSGIAPSWKKHYLTNCFVRSLTWNSFDVLLALTFV